MRRPTVSPLASALALLLSSAAVTAVPADNTFEIVGNSGVSAQQVFLGQSNKVYVIDKTENNPLRVNGHPAWATEYDLSTNTPRAMDIKTNSFCAGGNVLGNGTWVNIGGNQPIGPGGLNAASASAPYEDTDGGKAVRTLDVCADASCDWTDNAANYMTTRRWYPTLETVEDGSIIIIGGCDFGGYVNDAGQNNPTYEFFPTRGGPVGLNILTTSLPANLFSLTWLLPSGNLLIQTNLATEIFDYKNNVEYPLANMPHAVRTYPGSAATAMMPLTPANNWTATVLFCGGTNLQPDQWMTTWNIAAYPADSTCVSITPDQSTAWVDEEPLPEGRVMGNWIFLPDGRLVLLNGQGLGTAGYGNTSWAVGQSFGDEPRHSAHYFDYNKPVGQRFSPVAATSTVSRMYHSSATLLADGSIFSSGSNPNADFIPSNNMPAGYKYPTEYRVEKFYPDYYLAPRPVPTGIPKSLGYGGKFFNIALSASDVGAASNLDSTKVTIVRPGFSTHAMNMGQRFLQLDSTFSVASDGSATLHVSQLPPNPAILVPGPALLFVVVNGVPSNGTWIMIGNGQIGVQPVSAAQALPASTGGDGGAWNAGNAVVTQTSIAPSSAVASATGKTSSSSGSTGATGSTGSSSTGTTTTTKSDAVVLGASTLVGALIAGSFLLL